MFQMLSGESLAPLTPQRVSGAAEVVAQVLLEADRLGADEDRPEGARYIQISDTLANQLAKRLLEAANAERKNS